MSVPDKWKAVIAEGHTVRAVEEGIYSVLPDRPQAHLYDGRAAIYDLVVRAELYNRVMWGASLSDYESFARQAIGSAPTGMVLDAGCGSLLFTAQTYLDSNRPILAFDQSLQMLRRARSRLIKLGVSLPDRILLLQADLNSLPFRPTSFQTVICMNVLHHFAAADNLLANLTKLSVDGGQLYVTSLVKADRLIGDKYLNALYQRGDFVRPRTGMELREVLAGAFGQGVDYWRRGNMAFAIATCRKHVPSTVAGLRN